MRSRTATQHRFRHRLRDETGEGFRSQSSRSRTGGHGGANPHSPDPNGSWSTFATFATAFGRQAQSIIRGRRPRLQGMPFVRKNRTALLTTRVRCSRGRTPRIIGNSFRPSRSLSISKAPAGATAPERRCGCGGAALEIRRSGSLPRKMPTAPRNDPRRAASATPGGRIHSCSFVSLRGCSPRGTIRVHRPGPDFRLVTRAAGGVIQTHP